MNVFVCVCVCQFFVFQIVTHVTKSCMHGKVFTRRGQKNTVCVIYNSIRTSNFGFFCKCFLHFSNTKKPEYWCASNLIQKVFVIGLYLKKLLKSATRHKVLSIRTDLRSRRCVTELILSFQSHITVIICFKYIKTVTRKRVLIRCDNKPVCFEVMFWHENTPTFVIQ